MRESAKKLLRQLATEAELLKARSNELSSSVTRDDLQSYAQFAKSRIDIETRRLTSLDITLNVILLIIPCIIASLVTIENIDLRMVRLLVAALSTILVVAQASVSGFDIRSKISYYRQLRAELQSLVISMKMSELENRERDELLALNNLNDILNKSLF